ncbi:MULTISPECIES: hypothetical protein [Streptomyces]|uniref:hypothetical protein n=1 Tax=Streptomyces lycopersici TaxID=2974589 RepID=UPI0021D08C41|nr:hypothetical protein [Streptomyces sp. NEAU-383]
MSDEQPTASQPGSATLDALPSPLDSVDGSRATARWIIASTGAVGALLLGGGPLLAVGRITDWEHGLWAGAGLLLALSGVAWALWRTSDVLVPAVMTPAQLDSPALRGLREQFDAAPWYYFGSVATSLDDLLRHRQIAANIAALLRSAEPGDRDALRRSLLTAHRNIAKTDPYLRWVLATAHAWQVRETLHRARRHTFLGGVLVIAGAVTFLSATAGRH